MAMARLVCWLAIAGMALSVNALAQSDNGDDGDDSNDLSGRSAWENSRGGRVAERAPGTWVRAAIARHNELIAQRVRSPFGDNEDANEPVPEPRADAPTSTGLDGLLGLVNQFSGSLGSLGNLAGNLGVFGGGTTGSTTGTTGTSGSGVDPRLAALLELQAAANGGSSAAEEKSINQQWLNGGVKFADRAQTNGDSQDRKFTSRLVESWASAFFSAATLAFQTNNFVNLLKDAIRPLMFPEPDTTDDGSGGGSGNDGSGDDGSGDGGTGDGTGDGIEDIPSGNGDGSDSVI
jgi:hypothetical protein